MHGSDSACSSCCFQIRDQAAADPLAPPPLPRQAGVLQRLYVELCKRHDPGQYVAQGLQEKPGLLSQVDQQQVKRVRGAWSLGPAATAVGAAWG